MKNILKVISVILLLSVGLLAINVSQKECKQKGSNFLFVSGECIQFYEAKGDNSNTITILVHGTWPEGTNILAR